jgi:hypothetical protein
MSPKSPAAKLNSETKLSQKISTGRAADIVSSSLTSTNFDSRSNPNLSSSPQVNVMAQVVRNGVSESPQVSRLFTNARNEAVAASVWKEVNQSLRPSAVVNPWQTPSRPVPVPAPVRIKSADAPPAASLQVDISSDSVILAAGHSAVPQMEASSRDPKLTMSHGVVSSVRPALSTDAPREIKFKEVLNNCSLENPTSKQTLNGGVFQKDRSLFTPNFLSEIAGMMSIRPDFDL